MTNKLQFITSKPELTTERPEYITDDILVRLDGALFRLPGFDNKQEFNYDELVRHNYDTIKSFKLDKKIFDYLKDCGVILIRVKHHEYFERTIRWYERNHEMSTYEINMR